MCQSSQYLNAISNRLAAFSSRAKFLGMAVGTALSELTDPPDRQMNFGAEELGSPDGRWYRNLPTISDIIGDIEDLKAASSPSQSPLKVAKVSTEKKREKTAAPAKPTSKIVAIEEIRSDSEPDTEDEDLPMYEKPDSDPSDEDEDPTLVQRNKPTAPVYATPSQCITKYNY